MALGLWLLSCQELYLWNVLRLQSSLPKAAPHFRLCARTERDGVPIGTPQEKWTPSNVMHTCTHCSK